MSDVRGDGEASRASRVVALAVPAALVVVAGLVRFISLGQPGDIVFDETYYVEDARSFLTHGAEEGFAVHPPVGKWLIALGIAVLGDDPTGWRVAAAVAGTASVLLVYLVGRRLFRRVASAGLAGLLVAVDGLHLVQSRIAMLDVFLVLFVVAGVWALLVHRDRRWSPLDDPGGGPEAVADDDPSGTRRGSPAGGWAPLALAGAAFGLAVATKWSGLLALAAAGLVVLAWEVTGRHRRGLRLREHALRSLAAIAAALVLVPTAVYVASYVPWLVGYAHTHEGSSECVVDGETLDPCPVGATGRLRGLGRHHVAMWRFHRDLEAEHPYLSSALTWPVLERPVVYHWASCPDEAAAEGCEEVAAGNAEEIVALGNPVLWWGALAAVIPLVTGALRRDGRAGLVLAFWASQYLPWLVPDRPLFIFYMAPVVPFMALGLAYAATATWRAGAPGPTRRARYLGSAVAILATVAFAYFYPVWTGVEMDEDRIRHRWWFESWV